MSAPRKTMSKHPLSRRRFSKRRIANALVAARTAGMAVRGLKIGMNGEIDIVFGKPTDAKPEG
jgi:hypothetical protein